MDIIAQTDLSVMVAVVLLLVGVLIGILTCKRWPE